MQVGGIRNDFGAGVKHHSPNPTFAHRIGHRLQTPNIASAQCGTRFHFHPHQSPTRQDLMLAETACATV